MKIIFALICGWEAAAVVSHAALLHFESSAILLLQTHTQALMLTGVVFA